MLDGDVMLNAACRAAAAWGLLLLAACAPPLLRDHSPETGRPAPIQAATPLGTPAQNDAVANAAFDWHSLVVAPFGTLLKDSPLRLHEVLLFHEQVQLVQTIQYGAILLLIIRERFTQTNESQATFVFDSITHDRK